jgi:hypothetical protein
MIELGSQSHDCWARLRSAAIWTDYDNRSDRQPTDQSLFVNGYINPSDTLVPLIGEAPQTAMGIGRRHESDGSPRDLQYSQMRKQTTCNSVLWSDCTRWQAASMPHICSKLPVVWCRQTRAMSVCRALRTALAARLSSNIETIKIYEIIIRPVVLNTCEIWSLTLREKQRLRVFDNRATRGIFGTWTKKIAS